MKYIYFVWNESFSTFFNCTLENIRNFEVHVFTKTGVKPVAIVGNPIPGWYNLHEVNANDDEFLFTALALAIMNKNLSFNDELILIDSHQDRCDYVLKQLKSRTSLKYSWIPIDSSTLLSSCFPANQVCSKCKIIFPDSYDKNYHEQRSCGYCRESTCCGIPRKHEDIWKHERCKAVNCNFTYRKCCPDQLERHLKDHPECPTCKKVFRRHGLCYDGESLAHHLQTHKPCPHCKKMTCDGKDHVKKFHWIVCREVGCELSFVGCTEDQHQNHLSTHPKCDCGCEKCFLSTEKLKEHLSPFQCNECNAVFQTASAWFRHSKMDDHVLLCSCQKCSATTNPYFAKAKKMKIHLKDEAVCKCGELFYSTKALEYHQKKCKVPVPPPVPPTMTIKQSKEKTSEIPIGAPFVLDPVDMMLATVVNENFRQVDCPIWTMTKEEKKAFNTLRIQIQAHLSTAKLFQLRVQGSAVKNTGIPAMADFDFILEVRNSTTTIFAIKAEISEQLRSICRFCYGDKNIQTWLTLGAENILFDVVIKFPNDSRFQDFERNTNLVKSQPNNVHSFIRALKYWCKRSNAPLKSFMLEFIGIHLFARSSAKIEFIEFLKFLTRNNWINDIKGLVETPTSEDLRQLQSLATSTLNALK